METITNQGVFTYPIPQTQFELQSQSISKITEALCKAQIEFKNIERTSENPFYKSTYSDLAVVLDSIRPILSKHGICFWQPTTEINGKIFVRTTLSHISGEWIASYFPVLSRDQTAHGLGSGTTYAKRYSIMGLCGVCPKGEADDGEAASHGPQSRVPQVRSSQSASIPEDKGGDYISLKQKSRLFAIAQENGWKAVDVELLVQERLKVPSEQMPWQKYNEVVEYFLKNPPKQVTVPNPRVAPRDSQTA